MVANSGGSSFLINYFMFKKIFFTIFILLAFINVAKADYTYIMMSGATGSVDESSNGCQQSSDGTIASDGTSTKCQVQFPLSLPKGSIIKTVTFYYYDTSGSQYFYAYLKKAYVNSSSSSTTIDSSSDTTTSTSVQSASLSGSSSLLNSAYTYYVYVVLGYSTQLRGILVSYQL